MNFATAVAHATGQWIAGDLSETVKYTPKDGLQKSIAAVILRDFPLQEPYVRGIENAICVIFVQRADVTNPQRGDKYTFTTSHLSSLQELDWYMDADGIVYADDDILEIALERELS